MTLSWDSSRRALTLVELLATLALIGAVAAVVLPALAGRLAGARTESALRGIETLLMESGAVASAEGVVVRVYASRASGVALNVRAWREPIDPNADDTTASERVDVDSPRRKAGDLVGALALERGASVSHEPPPDPQTPGAVPSVAAPRPSDGELLLVATFLPDGGALARDFFVTLGPGKAYEFRVERWTGTPRVVAFDVADESDAEVGAEPFDDTMNHEAPLMPMGRGQEGPS